MVTILETVYRRCAEKVFRSSRCELKEKLGHDEKEKKWRMLDQSGVQQKWHLSAGADVSMKLVLEHGKTTLVLYLHPNYTSDPYDCTPIFACAELDAATPRITYGAICTHADVDESRGAAGLWTVIADVQEERKTAGATGAKLALFP